jgi:hypothetical protein
VTDLGPWAGPRSGLIHPPSSVFASLPPVEHQCDRVKLLPSGVRLVCVRRLDHTDPLHSNGFREWSDQEDPMHSTLILLIDATAPEINADVLDDAQWAAYLERVPAPKLGAITHLLYAEPEHRDLIHPRLLPLLTREDTP